MPLGDAGKRREERAVAKLKGENQPSENASSLMANHLGSSVFKGGNLHSTGMFKGIFFIYECARGTQVSANFVARVRGVPLIKPGYRDGSGHP